MVLMPLEDLPRGECRSGVRKGQGQELNQVAHIWKHQYMGR